MGNTSQFGMAGHLAAMSEFLLRGYNVAIPYVDRGDDILTIEDDDSQIRRIQVKTSNLLGCIKIPCKGCRICRGEVLRLKYTLKTRQLRSPDRNTFLFTCSCGATRIGGGGSCSHANSSTISAMTRRPAGELASSPARS